MKLFRIIFPFCLILNLLLNNSCNPEVTPFDNSNRFDVVIVGGGLDALITGYMLKDKKVLIIDSNDSLGGEIKYRDWNGLNYSGMMQYMLPPSPEESEFFNSLGIIPVQIPPTIRAVGKNGNLYYGNQIMDFFNSEEDKLNYNALYSNIETLYDLFGYAVWDFQSELDNFREYDSYSLNSWLESGNYTLAVKDFVDINNQIYFGIRNSEFSAMYSIPGLYNNLPDPDPVNENNLYTFPKGFSDLINALSESLFGKISLNSEIIEVTINNDLSVLIKYLRAGQINYITTRSLVFAVPATEIDSIISPGFSSELINALSLVTYKPYITANLFTSDRLWKNSWQVSCINEFFVSFYDATRSQVPLNYQDESILGVNISLNNPEVLSWTDNDILQSIFSGLEKYLPEIRSKVIDFDIQRNMYAFPEFTPEYIQILKTLSEDNSTFGPLFITGNYLIYPSFEGTFISSRNTSNRVINYLDK